MSERRGGSQCTVGSWTKNGAGGLWRGLFGCDPGDCNKMCRGFCLVAYNVYTLLVSGTTTKLFSLLEVNAPLVSKVLKYSR